MSDEFEIFFKDSYVEVQSDADKTLEFARRMWTAIAEACRENDCYDVLGISFSRTPLRTSDGYAHAELFRELGIVRGYRIAWVELNEQAKSSPEFTTTVLFNRGLPGRLFDTVTDAKQWLLDKPGS